MASTARKKTIRTIPQERTPMPERPAKERAKSFQEVACGYTLENALREAERCLLCADAGASARRKASAKACASWATRWSL